MSAITESTPEFRVPALRADTLQPCMESECSVAWRSEVRA